MIASCGVFPCSSILNITSNITKSVTFNISLAPKITLKSLPSVSILRIATDEILNVFNKLSNLFTLIDLRLLFLERWAFRSFLLTDAILPFPE